MKILHIDTNHKLMLNQLNDLGYQNDEDYTSSKKEIEAMKRIPEKQWSRAFHRCWTRKEAFIKAEGSGLSFPLNRFAVSLDDDHQADLLETDWDATEKSNWSLFSFIPREQYIVAIALRNQNIAAEYFNWDNIRI